MAWVRRLLVGVLGVVLVIDALAGSFQPLQFAVGLIMIGLVPVDAVIDLLTRPASDEGQIDRLHEVMRKRESDEHP